MLVNCSLRTRLAGCCCLLQEHYETTAIPRTECPGARPTEVTPSSCSHWEAPSCEHPISAPGDSSSQVIRSQEARVCLNSALGCHASANNQASLKSPTCYPRKWKRTDLLKKTLFKWGIINKSHSKSLMQSCSRVSDEKCPSLTWHFAFTESVLLALTGQRWQPDSAPQFYHKAPTWARGLEEHLQDTPPSS